MSGFTRISILTAVWVAGLAGCSPEHEIILGCEAERGIVPVCGFQNPEDLVLLADGHTVIVSQMGTMDGARPGNLALFDLTTDTVRIVFSGGDAADPTPGFGDAACPGPPLAQFSPHGIDLVTRPDGRRELFVVNHGGREAVESFELIGTDATLDLAWRGCAVAPERGFFNDVVGLPEGGFLVTQMMDRDSPLWGTLQAAFGRDTGFVYEWTPERGFRPVPGTEGAMPNGIELSQDGRDVIVNLYFGDEVRRVARDTGETRASAEVGQPDNVTWSQDGRLLVASHGAAGLADQLACQNLEAGSCPFAFEILSIDPETFAVSPVFANAGPPMGAGTVAIDIGDDLLIGSFSGDRVIRVRASTP
jgi:hypothetical protein